MIDFGTRATFWKRQAGHRKKRRCSSRARRRRLTRSVLRQTPFARPNQEDAGAIAGFARVKENELALKPTNLSYAQATSVPLARLTTWQSLLTKGNLKKGDKVLIDAGSGGLGTFAIQIAKNGGAFVAMTVSKKNIELVKTLGADEVID